MRNVIDMKHGGVEATFMKSFSLWRMYIYPRACPEIRPDNHQLHLDEAIAFITSV